jgi:hypothetical protein
MAIIFSNDIRTAKGDATIDTIGAGAKLQIFTASYAVKLAEFVWTGNLSAGAADGVTVFDAPDETTVLGLAAGTAAIARIVNAADAVKVSGMTVGTSGTHVIVADTAILVGQATDWVSGSFTEGNAA